jgi:hypothetical protein
VDKRATGPPEGPAALAKNLVNGDKTDMVNGTLPIARSFVPCYRNRPGIRAGPGAATAKSL